MPLTASTPVASALSLPPLGSNAPGLSLSAPSPGTSITWRGDSKPFADAPVSVRKSRWTAFIADCTAVSPAKTHVVALIAAAKAFAAAALSTRVQPTRTDCSALPDHST